MPRAIQSGDSIETTCGFLKMKLFVLGFRFDNQLPAPVASRYGIDTTNRSRKELTSGEKANSSAGAASIRGDTRLLGRGFLSVYCPPNRKKTQPRRGSGWNRYHARRQYSNFHRWLSTSHCVEEHAKAAVPLFSHALPPCPVDSRLKLQRRGLGRLLRAVRHRGRDPRCDGCSFK